MRDSDPRMMTRLRRRDMAVLRHDIAKAGEAWTSAIYTRQLCEQEKAPKHELLAEEKRERKCQRKFRDTLNGIIARRGHWYVPPVSDEVCVWPVYAAAWLGVAPEALAEWRVAGKGPKFETSDVGPYYLSGDIRKYLRVKHSSKPAPTEREPKKYQIKGDCIDVTEGGVMRAVWELEISGLLGDNPSRDRALAIVQAVVKEMAPEAAEVKPEDYDQIGA